MTHIPWAICTQTTVLVSLSRVCGNGYLWWAFSQDNLKRVVLDNGFLLCFFDQIHEAAESRAVGGDVIENTGHWVCAGFYDNMLDVVLMPAWRVSEWEVRGWEGGKEKQFERESRWFTWVLHSYPHGPHKVHINTLTYCVERELHCVYNMVCS